MRAVYMNKHPLRVPFQEKYNISMKRIFLFALCVLFLGACAGNPPAWWNPGNRYGTAEVTTPAPQPAAPVRKAVPPTEEEMEPLPDNSYEEEVIAPLPEEEDMPAEVPVQEPALDEALPTPSVLD